jgi:hypothetical protein
LDLKIPFQEVEQKVILDNIRCDEHQTKMVVNIVLPWIDFKAAMISSWWSIIVCSAWSACLFKSQNVLTWVKDSNKEVIRQINIDNDNITTTKQIYCSILDMTLTSNNDILLSDNSSDIKLLTKSGEIKPYKIFNFRRNLIKIQV